MTTQAPDRTGPIEPLETTAGPPPWPNAKRYVVTIEGEGAIIVRRHVWADNAKGAATLIDPMRYRNAERWRLAEAGAGRRCVDVVAHRLDDPQDTHRRQFPKV